MTQTAASLDALLARPRSTPLEADMATAILDCRVTMFGPVTAQPPPPPPAGPANYTVSREQWDFRGNFRLPVTGVRHGVPVTIAFTTPNVLGLKAQINVAADPGYNGNHVMAIDGRSITSQTPSFLLVTGASVFAPPTLPFLPKVLQWQGLAPNSTYLITVTTNQGPGNFGDFHVNFQSAS